MSKILQLIADCMDVTLAEYPTINELSQKLSEDTNGITITVTEDHEVITLAKKDTAIINRIPFYKLTRKSWNQAIGYIIDETDFQLKMLEHDEGCINPLCLGGFWYPHVAGISEPCPDCT